MRDLKRQQGISVIALVAILALVVFFVTIGVRLFPIYMEYFTVDSIVEDLAAQGGASKKSITEFRNSAGRHFSVNSVSRVKLENITVEEKAGKRQLLLKYEVRTPMIANVDGVVMFEKRHELQP